MERIKAAQKDDLHKFGREVEPRQCTGMYIGADHSLAAGMICVLVDKFGKNFLHKLIVWHSRCIGIKM